MNRGAAEARVRAGYKTRDLWEHKDVGTQAGHTATVPSHGVVMLRLSR